ncbi:hypothetical protein [Phaeobacter gallaeciensis]|uniref:hypothetical protein n=1 Tax=Phaeobacter gallaeciensis TaxID=60890 RepID=UPI003B969DA3
MVAQMRLSPKTVENHVRPAEEGRRDEPDQVCCDVYERRKVTAQSRRPAYWSVAAAAACKADIHVNRNDPR